jgi:hypothetical protein
MERNQTLRVACIVSLVAAMIPAASAAVRVRQCIAGKPTAASYTWNFQKEADNIFGAIQSDAVKAQYHAEKLKSFAWDMNLSWQGHADQLWQLKTEINDMGGRVCRLETIRRVVAPWQQRTIDRIASTVRLMAVNAQNAIVFLNHNQQMLWSPTYRHYSDHLCLEASSLTQSVAHAVEYARVGAQYQQLRSDIGVKASS